MRSSSENMGWDNAGRGLGGHLGFCPDDNRDMKNYESMWTGEVAKAATQDTNTTMAMAHNSSGSHFRGLSRRASAKGMRTEAVDFCQSLVLGDGWWQEISGSRDRMVWVRREK